MTSDVHWHISRFYTVTRQRDGWSCKVECWCGHESFHAAVEEESAIRFAKDKQRQHALSAKEKAAVVDKLEETT